MTTIEKQKKLISKFGVHREGRRGLINVLLFDMRLKLKALMNRNEPFSGRPFFFFFSRHDECILRKWSFCLLVIEKEAGVFIFPGIVTEFSGCFLNEKAYKFIDRTVPKF